VFLLLVAASWQRLPPSNALPSWVWFWLRPHGFLSTLSKAINAKHLAIVDPAVTLTKQLWEQHPN
jgi:hypothetical protein